MSNPPKAVCGVAEPVRESDDIDIRLELEAVEHVIAAVSLGLWLVPDTRAGSGASAAAVLERQPADVLLRRAFHAASDSKLRLKPKSAAKALSDVRTLLRTMKV